MSIPSTLMRLVVVMLFLVATGCVRLNYQSSRPDDVLIENFKKHQAEFQELHQMFLSDKGLTRVDFDFTRPEAPSKIGITQQRLDRYRRMFVELDLKSGIGADGKVGREAKDTVWFFAAAPRPRKSSQKHYLYMKSAPEGTIDNLDDPLSKLKPYRHIQGNWYLFLEDLD